MSAHACCRVSAPGDHGATRREKTDESSTALVRASRLASWIAPSATLVILPKCPMCLAAYVAAATGIGISAQAASGLRMGLIGICLVALTYVTAKSLLRAIQ